MKKLLLVVFAVASLAVSGSLVTGCGSGVQFVRQDITEYPPKSEDAEIKIFDGGVMTPHVVIGTMKAGKEVKASFGEGSTYDEVLESMKKHARKIGADALINVRLENISEMSARVDLTATAVRYLTESTKISSKDS